jgi:hypothetical protein
VSKQNVWVGIGVVLVFSICILIAAFQAENKARQYRKELEDQEANTKLIREFDQQLNLAKTKDDLLRIRQSAELRKDDFPNSETGRWGFTFLMGSIDERIGNLERGITTQVRPGYVHSGGVFDFDPHLSLEENLANTRDRMLQRGVSIREADAAINELRKAELEYQSKRPSSQSDYCAVEA